MANELALAGDVNLDDLQRTASMLAASGYFDSRGDARTQIAQLATKILAGREMGYGPFASVQGIHVIKGKPTLSANLMAAAVKNHASYDYRVRKMDDDGVSIEFFEHGESIGVSSFDMADAKKAGVAGGENWKKYPRNMLFARAMSNGVRFYCPDVFSGNTVYTPDEIDASDESTGDRNWAIVEQHDAEMEEKFQDNGVVEEVVFQDEGELTLADAENVRKAFHATGTEFYGEKWDEKRREFCEAKGLESSNDLPVSDAQAWIDKVKEKIQEKDGTPF